MSDRRSGERELRRLHIAGYLELWPDGSARDFIAFMHGRAQVEGWPMREWYDHRCRVPFSHGVRIVRADMAELRTRPALQCPGDPSGRERRARVRERHRGLYPEAW